jgi:hypothetical protein
LEIGSRAVASKPGQIKIHQELVCEQEVKAKDGFGNGCQNKRAKESFDAIIVVV